MTAILFLQFSHAVMTTCVVVKGFTLALLCCLNANMKRVLPDWNAVQEGLNLQRVQFTKHLRWLQGPVLATAAGPAVLAAMSRTYHATWLLALFISSAANGNQYLLLCRTEPFQACRSAKQGCQMRCQPGQRQGRQTPHLTCDHSLSLLKPALQRSGRVGRLRVVWSRLLRCWPSAIWPCGLYR